MWPSCSGIGGRRVDFKNEVTHPARPAQPPAFPPECGFAALAETQGCATKVADAWASVFRPFQGRVLRPDGPWKGVGLRFCARVHAFPRRRRGQVPAVADDGGLRPPRASEKNMKPERTASPPGHSITSRRMKHFSCWKPAGISASNHCRVWWRLSTSA